MYALDKVTHPNFLCVNNYGWRGTLHAAMESPILGLITPDLCDFTSFYCPHPLVI